jgi:hypothetical protein
MKYFHRKKDGQSHASCSRCNESTAQVRPRDFFRAVKFSAGPLGITHLLKQVIWQWQRHAMPWPEGFSSGPCRTASPGCPDVRTPRNPGYNASCGLPLTCAPCPNDALPVPCHPPRNAGCAGERNFTNQDLTPPGREQKK